MSVAKIKQALEAREAATVRALKGRWAANAAANRAQVARQVDELWLQGNPRKGVLVAAGPSLAESYAELAALDRRDHEILVVDMAFKGLLASGIVPDFVIAADANPVIGDLLEEASAMVPKVPLLLADVADPSVAKRWKGPVYWYGLQSSHFDEDAALPMQEDHQRRSGVTARLSPGGNVSSLGLSFLASVRACAQVLLYGHDFCWTEDTRFYAPGAPAHLAKERVDSEAAAGTTLEIKAADGSPVKTNLSLLNFVSWYRSVDRAMPGLMEQRTPRTILSLGGL